MSFLRRPVYKKVDYDWVYDKIQNRLGDNAMEEDVLRDYIEETGSVICNYINRTYIPEPLKFVFVNMTMDLLKSLAINGDIDNDKLSEINLGRVSKIEDGDSQIQFNTSSSSANSGVHVGDPDSLLYNYTSQLDKYRLLKW